MIHRTRPLLLVAGLLFLAGALAAACGGESAGGSDPLPTRSGTPIPPAIEDYLNNIADIFANITRKIGKIEAAFEDDFAGANKAENADEALGDAIRDYQGTISNTSSKFRSLRPAAEATVQHDVLATALDRANTSMDALEEEYRAIRGGDRDGEVRPAQVALAAQVTEAFTLIGTELEDACLELQDLAAEQEVEIDLNCSEEAPAPTGSPTPTSSPEPTEPPA